MSDAESVAPTTHTVSPRTLQYLVRRLSTYPPLKRAQADVPVRVHDLWLLDHLVHRVQAELEPEPEEREHEEDERDPLPHRGRGRVEAWVRLEATMELSEVARGLLPRGGVLLVTRREAVVLVRVGRHRGCSSG